MCYQHSISYLFPVIKNNVSLESGKIEEENSAHKLIPVKSEEDHIEIREIEEVVEEEKKLEEEDRVEKKVDEEEEKFDEEEKKIEEGKKIEQENEVEKKKFAGENGEEQNGNAVDPKKCTQGVCENVPERKERVAKKLSSLKLKDILRKIKRRREEQNAQKIPLNEQKVPIKGKKGGRDSGKSKKRGRKIAEKGGNFARISEGSGSGVGKKRRKRDDVDNGLLKEGEEEGEEGGGIVKRRKMKDLGKEAADHPLVRRKSYFRVIRVRM